MNPPSIGLADSDTALRPPLWSLAIASAAALAFEILLTRLFAVVHWHHFAYMIISLALLGYGLSGTVLALSGSSLTGTFRRSYPLLLAVFALTMPLCFLAAQSITVHPEALLWRPDLWWRLPVVYLILAVPFFFVALAVALSLSRFAHRPGMVYAADLTGAGAGSVLVLLMIWWWLPDRALWGLSCLGAAAALIALAEFRRFSVPTAAVVTLALLMPLIVPAEHARLKVSDFKPLSQTLSVSGAVLEDTLASPLGVIDVVASEDVPFREAPGLSMNSIAVPPAQLALFTDAGAMSVINAWSGPEQDVAWLRDALPALPYTLSRPGHILVLDAGGGTEVLRAVVLGETAGGGPQIDAVEPNPLIVRLLRERYARFSGDLYGRPGVRVHSDDARGFLAAAGRRWDLIVLPPPGAPGGGAGLGALSERYDFTIEAFAAYLNALRPGGFLAVPSWLQLPPRDGIRLLATAAAALGHQPDGEFASQVVMIRNWQMSLMLVGAAPVTPAQVAALAAFCERLGFDLVWYPGMPASAANRVNRLPAPWLHEVARALADGSSASFFERYKFDVRPVTDDRPFFHQFLKWRFVPEAFGLRSQGGMGLMESGLVMLLATLAQALLAAALLVLLPLWLQSRRQSDRSVQSRRGSMIYFALLGLAFMAIEMAFIQKFRLFLLHPVYAVTVVLAGFLVFAGVGSALAGRLARKLGGAALPAVVAGIAVLALGYVAGQTAWQAFFATLPLPGRVALALCLLAPLAMLMGMPFPIGLERLSARDNSAVPWAWAVNASASVVSAVLATLFAMRFGFSTVILGAVCCYLLCPFLGPKPQTAS